jgi:hypothetical protein
MDGVLSYPERRFRDDLFELVGMDNILELGLELLFGFVELL